MSARNLFILNKASGYGSVELENLKAELYKLALAKNIGIHFNLQGYQDEILKLLAKEVFFCLSDNFGTPETDDLYSTVDAFSMMMEKRFNTNFTKKGMANNYLMEDE